MAATLLPWTAVSPTAAQCDIDLPVALLGPAERNEFLTARFGSDVATDGTIIVVGASGYRHLGLVSFGAAFIGEVEPSDGSWSVVQMLIPDTGTQYQNFGDTVAVHGDVAVVGAYRSDVAATNAGTAWVYRRDPGTGHWSEEQRLLPADLVAEDWFGRSVGVHGDTIVVGAYRSNILGEDSGKAYVYRYDTDELSWELEVALVPDDGESQDQFGYDVAVGAEVIAVSAPNGGPGDDRGAVYTFDRNAPHLAPYKHVVPNASPDNGVYALGLSGDALIVGSNDDDEQGSNAGAAYFWQRIPGSHAFTLEYTFLASDGLPGDAFGAHVAVDGDFAAIGATGVDVPSDGAGAVYLFARSGPGWVEVVRATNPEPELFSVLTAVSIGAGALLVGDTGDNNAGGYGAGAVQLLPDLEALVEVFLVDCNGNSIRDCQDIVIGLATDCNVNHVPDGCEVSQGTSFDCNGNGLPDECDGDCNGNGLADGCDIADGTSLDEDGDGVPDECPVVMPVPSAEHPTIQSAIDAAAFGRTIELADGVHSGPGNRNLDFRGKALTLRSAGGPDVCTIDCGNITGGRNRGFLFVNDEGPDTRVEGITISGGWADNILPGGGARCVDASPTLVDCVFRDCEATFDDSSNDTSRGAGLYSLGGHPTLVGCRFEDCDAYGGFNSAAGAALYSNGPVTAIGCEFVDNRLILSFTGEFVEGGAVWASSGSTFLDCTFTSNRANSAGSPGRGGALHVEGAVAGCTFVDNHARQGSAVATFGAGATVGHCVFELNRAGEGGAIYDDHDSVITDSVFVGNVAWFSDSFQSSGRGGAIRTSGTAVTRCTFAGNHAETGGGALWGFVTVSNSILWGNTPEQALFASISSSIVQGGWPGGNLDVDPEFVLDPDPGPDGNWGSSDDVIGDVHLRPGSPAIDAGNNLLMPSESMLDADGHPRYVDDPGTIDTGFFDCMNPVADIGAHEFQDATPRPSDVDGDGATDIDDIVQVVLDWGPCPGCPSDIDGDGAVDIDDIVLVCLEFGCTSTTCRPDCNDNGIDDAIDLYLCTSFDDDGNGIPDECDR